MKQSRTPEAARLIADLVIEAAHWEKKAGLDDIS
jgi:hypothetical protein